MRVAIRIAAVAALAIAVSGCDKCGNWFGQGTPVGKPGACQSSTPR
ncbi:hypothetical protein GGQ86_001777 [Xanthobacter flavus]|uniref:Lipoprotein n=1 Tax=Xanthobacter flavus TaxID=281 RepID=A0A9W6CIZ3_XANFL|nr:hypothetical protein [Xanthobacter flavus]MDR6333313.1 hypothetical protein [Xanthobacter flavus]GLI21589.1 hypothetical protein XFLAVUS301_12630 [Xanthobacter flavus]